MKFRRAYCQPKKLRLTLLLAGCLLAIQTLVLWHTHHGTLKPDASCQLCQYAQHHTPATNDLLPPPLILFKPVVITRQAELEVFHQSFRIVLPARDPPTSYLA